MSDLTDLNGNSLHGETVITLKYKHETGKLELGGDLSNLDRVLNMLGQASRYLECQYRMQQAAIAKAIAEQEQAIMSQVGPRLIT